MPMNSSPEERDDLIIKLAGVDASTAQAPCPPKASPQSANWLPWTPSRVSIRTGLSFRVYPGTLVNANAAAVGLRRQHAEIDPGTVGVARVPPDVLALDNDWRAGRTPSPPRWRCCDRPMPTSLRHIVRAMAAAQAKAAPAQGEPGRRSECGSRGRTSPAGPRRRMGRIPRGSRRGQSTVAVPRMRRRWIAALTVATADGGPGLTAVGVDTIRQRLRDSSYAALVKNLLDSRKAPWLGP